jgi:hypothetical protein
LGNSRVLSARNGCGGGSQIVLVVVVVGASLSSSFDSSFDIIDDPSRWHLEIPRPEPFVRSLCIGYDNSVPVLERSNIDHLA